MLNESDILLFQVSAGLHTASCDPLNIGFEDTVRIVHTFDIDRKFVTDTGWSVLFYRVCCPRRGGGRETLPVVVLSIAVAGLVDGRRR